MKSCFYPACSIEFQQSYRGQVYCSPRCAHRDQVETHDQARLVDIDPTPKVSEPDWRRHP